MTRGISSLRSLLLWTLAFGIAVDAARAGTAATDAAEPAGEVIRREVVDPERSAWTGTGARKIGMTLRFPTSGASGTPRPFVLLSHGSGGDSTQLDWLAEALVARGFATASVQHLGTPEAELGGALAATDFFPWERARDLSVVLSAVLEDADLRERVDPARIGAAGFSLGGASVIWLGGARLDLEAMRRDAPPPVPYLKDSIDALAAYARTDRTGQASMVRAEQSYHDPRIRAVFALGPAIGFGFTESSLQAVRVPVAIVVGDADLVAPADANACRYARGIPGCILKVLPGERGHFIRTVERAQQAEELAEVAGIAAGFFEAELLAERRTDGGRAQEAVR